MISIEKNSSGSTGNIFEVDDNKKSIKTKSFSDMIEDLKLDISDYQIIKIDTDGFDWDCMNSIYQYLNFNQKKIRYLFYEHQTFLNNLGPLDPKRKLRSLKYFESLKNLGKIGLNYYYIFDNYGTFISSTNDIEFITLIDDYLSRSVEENNKPSFYFCDVLICNAEDRSIVEKTLKDYSSIQEIVVL